MIASDVPRRVSMSWPPNIHLSRYQGRLENYGPTFFNIDCWGYNDCFISKILSSNSLFQYSNEMIDC